MYVRATAKGFTHRKKYVSVCCEAETVTGPGGFAVCLKCNKICEIKEAD